MSNSGFASLTLKEADDAFARIVSAKEVRLSGVDVADILLLFAEISNLNIKITKTLAKVATGEISSEDIRDIERLCNKMKDEVGFLAIELAQQFRPENEQD